MRIVTRPDFDGLVCAVLLYDVLKIDQPVLWTEPYAMQTRQIPIKKDDIIANLSYHENCLLWFDHHESNRLNHPFPGVFKLEPSAARVVYDFFRNFDKNKYPHLVKDLKPFNRDFTNLINATDKIDAARLTLDEVLHPEKYPYVAVARTVKSHRKEDEHYWNYLTEMLRKNSIDVVFKDTMVQKYFQRARTENNAYHSHVKNNTILEGKVSITDFRGYTKMPTGNRFLVFSIFPQTTVNVKIRYHDRDREKVIVSLGHSIFNRKCNVNVGLLCARFGGGGHRGAGSCNFHIDDAQKNISEIISVLKNDESS